MDDCIFCKIVKGEAPSYKVYEDENYLGILDIFPVTEGHTLLIPRKHYRWVHDVPEFGKYWETSLKLAKSIQKATGAKWMQYFTHGLIPHAHIHVLPRYDDVDTSNFAPKGKIEKPSDEEFKNMAEKIRKELS